MRVPVLAGFGGKFVQYPKISSFIFFTGNVGVDDSNRQKKYEKEMHEAARKATEKINKEDEVNIEDRVGNAKGETDKAFREAKKLSDSPDKPEGLNRQYQKWTDIDDCDRSVECEEFDPSQNREGRVKEAWRKLGEEWGSESAKEKGK